ncbi:MAG: hypothetical protein NDI61_04040 [Bdellovibrionaceae bacterium]|nr:hypothetical protein [Pseudobdellovibrionaceae bacterium]
MKMATQKFVLGMLLPATCLSLLTFAASSKADGPPVTPREKKIHAIVNAARDNDGNPIDPVLRHQMEDAYIQNWFATEFGSGLSEYTVSDLESFARRAHVERLADRRAELREEDMRRQAEDRRTLRLITPTGEARALETLTDYARMAMAETIGVGSSPRPRALSSRMSTLQLSVADRQSSSTQQDPSTLRLILSDERFNYAGETVSMDKFTKISVAKLAKKLKLNKSQVEFDADGTARLVPEYVGDILFRVAKDKSVSEQEKAILNFVSSRILSGSIVVEAFTLLMDMKVRYDVDRAVARSLAETLSLTELKALVSVELTSAREDLRLKVLRASNKDILEKALVEIAESRLVTSVESIVAGALLVPEAIRATKAERGLSSLDLAADSESLKIVNDLKAHLDELRHPDFEKWGKEKSATVQTVIARANKSNPELASLRSVFQSYTKADSALIANEQERNQSKVLARLQFMADFGAAVNSNASMRKMCHDLFGK